MDTDRDMRMAQASDLTTAHLDGLELALAEGGSTHDLEHVLAAALRGDAQIWIDGPCTIVTEVNDGPKERELHFWLAAGSLERVIALSNRLLAWGRTQGCTIATLCGRRGWAKVLLSEGWNHRMITMGRRLDG